MMRLNMMLMNNVISTDESWDTQVGAINRNKQFLTIATRGALERLITTFTVIISELEIYMDIKRVYDEWKSIAEKVNEIKSENEKSCALSECQKLMKYSLMLPRAIIIQLMLNQTLHLIGLGRIH